MKNVNNPGQPEKGSPLGVSLTIDEVSLLNNLVEKLAHRRYDAGCTDEAMPEGWQAIETSTIEAYVSGSMDVFGEDDHLSMAYATCFSFTCTKLAGEENSLAWINSLS